MNHLPPDDDRRRRVAYLLALLAADLTFGHSGGAILTALERDGMTPDRAIIAAQDVRAALLSLPLAPH